MLPDESVELSIGATFRRLGLLAAYSFPDAVMFRLFVACSSPPGRTAIRPPRTLPWQSGLLKFPSGVLSNYEGWTRAAVSVHPGRSAMLRLSSPAGEVHYLKVVRRGCIPSAEAEACRTSWARSFLPVPRVLRHGATTESTWLVTACIDGIDQREAARSFAILRS